MLLLYMFINEDPVTFTESKTNKQFSVDISDAFSKLIDRIIVFLYNYKNFAFFMCL